MPHQPDQSDFQFELPAIDVQGMPEDGMATRLTFPEGCSHRVYGADAVAARRSMGTVVGRSAREDISEVTCDEEGMRVKKIGRYIWLWSHVCRIGRVKQVGKWGQRSEAVCSRRTGRLDRAC
jgi:hypothetical protein